MEETQELVKWSSTHQYFAAIIVNLIAFTQGCAYGWASPAIPHLMSNNTPLRTGPLSIDQMSWIGSINAVGAIFSSLIFGYFISLLGAKRAAISIAIPYVIAYLLIYFGDTFVHILMARFLSGFAGGGTDCTITIFISEISSNNIRGRLASMTPLLRNLGILFSFIIGARVEYKYVPCIYIVVPIVFVMAFILFPNSPQYHLQRSQTQKAESALKFYKGYKGANSGLQTDIAFHKELEPLKAIANEPKSKQKTTISDFYNRNALKGLGIGIALFTFLPFTAMNIITSYAVTTLQELGISIDPYTSSIVLALALIFGSLTSTYLADIMGRRRLNLISFIGAAAGFAGTAVYHHLNQNYLDLGFVTWIPVGCLFFVVFISAAGITSLISVCCVEHLPPNIRTAGMAIIYFWANICQFVSLKTYPKLLELVGMLGFLRIYGFGCVVSAIFVFFVVKETAGKSIDDIAVNGKARNKASPDDISIKI